MSTLPRRWGRDSRRRPASARVDLETLEARTLLSGTGASAAASRAKVSSITVLQASLPTAVTGANITFTASVKGAASGAPIASGKVNFEAEGPQHIALGDVKVNSQSQASVSTDQLTQLGNERVEARYIPGSSRVAASAAAVTVKVIPQPLHVPTTITLESGAPRAESGQYVPLLATVKDAGTGNQVDAGKVEPLSGTVQFTTDSPHPVVLGQVALNPTKSSSSILSAIQSIFGLSNQPTTTDRRRSSLYLDRTS